MTLFPLRRLAPILGTAALLAVGPSHAEPVSPGVEYREFDLPGPTKAYVVEVDRSDPALGLELGFPFEKRSSSTKEGVTAIAARYDEPPLHDVLAAVNGSFFGQGNNTVGPLATRGHLVQPPAENYDRPLLVLGLDGAPRIVPQPSTVRSLAFLPDGSTVPIAVFNEDRTEDALAVYTPAWGPSTATTMEGTEVVLGEFTHPWRPNRPVTGVVCAVRTGPASLDAPIPPDGAVLSARGALAGRLAALRPGDRVLLEVNLSTEAIDDSTMMILGMGWILKDGAANTAEWAAYGEGFRGRHPRTLVAWNADRLFLVVVDGRQPELSVGMTFDEMAAFCLDHLGATDAINLDGGGSSAIVVDGALKNSPSDGKERPVVNAVLLHRRPAP